MNLDGDNMPQHNFPEDSITVINEAILYVSVTGKGSHTWNGTNQITLP